MLFHEVKVDGPTRSASTFRTDFDNREAVESTLGRECHADEFRTTLLNRLKMRWHAHPPYIFENCELHMRAELVGEIFEGCSPARLQVAGS